jgi:L-rhamnose mutarotase
MQRVAQTIRLRPELREEYLRLHDAVWPGVEAGLGVAPIRNAKIFLRGNTLFAYFEYWGDDLARDMEAIGADPETQRWWRLTDPCQEPWPDRGTGGNWSDLAPVWHLSEPAREP